MTDRGNPDRGSRSFDRARREWRGRGGLESYYEANRYYANPDAYPRDDWEEDWDDDDENEETSQQPERQRAQEGREAREYGGPTHRGPQRETGPRRYRDQGNAYRTRVEGDRLRPNRPGYSQFDEDADYGYRMDPRTQHARRDMHWSEYEGYDQAYGAAGMRSETSLDYKNENDFGRDQGSWSPGQEFAGRPSRGWEGGRGRVDYTCIGPASYHRSDARIEEEICERLTMHRAIDARGVEVSVQDGQVTISGSVPSRMMKRMAEDTAADVFGVKDVQNNIRVNQADHNRSGRETRNSSSEGQRENAGSQGKFNDPESEKRRPFDGRREDEPSAPMQTTLESDLSSEARVQQRVEPRSAITIYDQLRKGMAVLGKDGKDIGRVKDTRQDDFVLQRGLAVDLTVPYSAILSVGESVLLNIEANAVDDQGWDGPAD